MLLFRKIKKWILTKLIKNNNPFKIAYTDKIDGVNSYEYPSEMKIKLSEFDCEERHYLIYL